MTDKLDTAPILTFPHQLMTADELRALNDDEMYLFQARLHATKLIAAIQSGRLAPEPAIIQNIRNLNALLDAFGEALDIAFLEDL